MLPLLLAVLYPCASVAWAQNPAAPDAPPEQADARADRDGTGGTAMAGAPAEVSGAAALSDRLVIAKLQYNRACTEAKERRLSELQRARETRIAWYEKLALVFVSAVLGLAALVPMISLWYERGAASADEKENLKAEIEKALQKVSEVADQVGEPRGGDGAPQPPVARTDVLRLVDILSVLSTRVSQLRVAPVASAWATASNQGIAFIACLVLAAIVFTLTYWLAPAEVSAGTIKDLCTEVAVP